MPEHDQDVQVLQPGEKIRGLPKWYPVENIEVNKEEGSNQGGDVDVDNTFLLTGIQWQIMADGNNPNAPLQDGNFLLGWSISRTNKFYKGADPSAFNYGSPAFGIWRPLDLTLKISQKRALEVIITNTVDRADKLIVQVNFVGIEPWPDVNVPEDGF
jgi:hypothetical protein